MAGKSLSPLGGSEGEEVNAPLVFSHLQSAGVLLLILGAREGPSAHRPAAQRCCTGSSCRTEWQITSKCFGKEGSNRINTKHADSFLQFACRAFSAGSGICIPVA